MKHPSSLLLLTSAFRHLPSSLSPLTSYFLHLPSFSCPFYSFNVEIVCNMIINS